ncbi:MAG: HD domain-containing protein [Defluviitaleaceae bacterium]|nr:HD domain-containing protein [Defluviitaleaceae bacterium]
MKIFRDPIHNVIDLDTGDEAANELVIKLIDTREFQRLRSIRQLGFAYFAYPSATHTRFEHSLGVAFLAKRFLEKIVSLEDKVLTLYKESAHRQLLSDFFARIRKDKAVTIIAALLHDIGHGPLSHTFETILKNSRHENWTKAIISGESEVNSLLAGFDASFPQKVCGILSESDESMPSAKIITGQLDIDKIDYLLRDSYMTGAGYGKFDVEWLFNVLTVGVRGDQVEVGLDLGKGLSVAEDFVMARIYMFRNIYLHKTSIIAQTMLKLLLDRIRELPPDATDKLFPNDSLRRILQHGAEPVPHLLEDYISISDIDLFAFLKLLQTSEDEVLSSLSRGLLERRLFKRIDPRDLGAVTQLIFDVKGRNMQKYHLLTELNSNAALTYHAAKEYILLFDKHGQGFPLHEKSKIIPASFSEDFPVEYYVEQGIYHQWSTSHLRSGLSDRPTR